MIKDKFSKLSQNKYLKSQTILLYLLFSFSIYCALVIDQSWDEGSNLIQGKITFDYLFSLGRIDKDIIYREYYSTIYWSLLYFVTEIFPSKYQIEVGHLFNLIFSLGAIFGIANVGKELFNKKVGKIIFIILFFYPIFFGHMSVNSKDTILAFSHVWIFYLILRYLKKQNIKKKVNKYLITLGLLTALSTGIQLVFLGSLIPIFLFVLIEIIFLKKIINKHFSKKKFFYDLIKCFIIFYSILILFWIDVHENILVYPFSFIQEWFFGDFKTGWPWNLINGNYYLSTEVPASYFLINFIYKSPEYILISYLLFFVLLFKSRNFYKKKFQFFNYKFSFIVVMLVFPNLILSLISFPVYDGMRLFLWILPYFCIIPGLTIYYLIENLNIIKAKITLLALSLFIIYYLFNFLTITPYQYTYLNFLNGKKEDRYKKFENDYWGLSINELIKNVNFKSKEVIRISTCGINDKNLEKYLKKRLDLNYKFVSFEDADYIIMTNRVMFYKGAMNCFEKFKGNDIASVKRNGLILSVIRKIKA